MSTEIDNKIVKMQFDNQRFEKNVEHSMGTLDKLKQSLNFKGVEKGFEDVDKAAHKLNLSGLTNAVDTVRMKFSAMEVFAITTLTNIANSAFNAGKRIMNALTIDPLKTGFSEYETKMGSIQTIMSNTASKGTTMADVTKVIDELNTYADKTIYNFSEMTRNIGTFTAAGVGLETSAKAIQGIANLAAESGSTSMQASTAMYQLSQALSSGTVKLMDWNSVVNAGMGGEKFRTAILETAKEHGAAVDHIIKDQGKFRDSLQTGWFTAEILTDTLEKYTVEGAKKYSAAMLESGKYTQEQADALIKSAQAAEDAATKVKTLTQLWDTLKEAAQSGWGQTWEIIVGNFEEAKELFTNISYVIGGMIGKSAEARNVLLSGWKDMGGRTKIIDGFKNIFDSLMAFIKPISEAFREIFPPMTVSKLLMITDKFKEFTETLRLSLKQLTIIKKIARGVFSVFSILSKSLKIVVNLFAKLISKLKPTGNSFFELLAKIGDFIYTIDKSIDSTNIFVKIVDKVGKIINKVSTIMSNGIELFKDSLGDISGSVSTITNKIKDMKNAIISAFSSIGKATKKDSFVDKLKTILYFISSIAKTAITGLGKAISFIVQKIGNMDFGALFDVFNGGLFATIGLSISKFIKDISSSFGNIKGSFDGVVDILDSVRGCFEAYQTKLKADVLKQIAIAIAILAASLIGVSFIDSDKLSSALAGLGGLITTLILSMKSITKMPGDTNKLLKLSMAMKGISVAALIMAVALNKIAKLKIEDILKGLLGLSGIATILTVVANKINFNSKRIVKGSFALILISGAINILVKACENLSKMSWEEIGKGLAGVGALFLEIAGFLKIAKIQKNITSTSFGILILSGAILLLAKAAKSFGELPIEVLKQGLAGIGGFLLELAIFSNIIGKADHVMSSSMAMLIVSGSLVILSHALKEFASMNGEQIIKSLFTMGVALTEIAIALNFMKGTIGGSFALLLATGALAMLAPILKMLGNMDTGKIVKSLLTIAGIFTIFGLAGYALGPVLPIIVGLNAALGLFSLAVIGFGVGLAAIGAGIALIATGITALSVAMVSIPTGFVAGLTGIIAAIVNIIPLVIKKLGEGLVSFVVVIGQSAEAIGGAVTKIVVAIVDCLVESIPVIVSGLLELLVAIMNAINDHIYEIVDLVLNILIKCLDVIADNLPKVVKSAIDVVLAFVDGISEAIPKVVDAAFELIISFIDGLATSIEENGPRLIDSIFHLFTSLIITAVSVFTSSYEQFKEIGKELLSSNFVQGIKDKFVDVKNIFLELIRKIGDWFKEKYNKFKEIGSNLIEGFIEGIKEMGSNVWSSITNFGSNVIDGLKNVLGINSPSVEAAKIAKFFGLGFTNKIDSMGQDAYKSAKKYGDNIRDGFKKSVDKALELMNNDSKFNPTITPIVDLSNVSSAMSKMDAWMTKRKALSLNTAIGNNGMPIDDATGKTNVGGNISFYQYNSSPKPLSRIDIYRNTKNQLSMAKGLVRKA